MFFIKPLYEFFYFTGSANVLKGGDPFLNLLRQDLGMVDHVDSLEQRIWMGFRHRVMPRRSLLVTMRPLCNPAFDGAQ